MCKRGNTVKVTAHHVGEIRLVDVDVDRCIAPIVRALNDGGIATTGCCCGHGETTGHISLANGKILGIFPNRKTYLTNYPVELSKTKGRKRG